MNFDQLVEDYYKSGQQRKEYCQQNNLNENSFKHRITSYHRSKIELSTNKEIQSQHQLIEAALEDTKEELIRVEDRCQQLQSQLEDLQRRYDDVNTQHNDLKRKYDKLSALDNDSEKGDHKDAHRRTNNHRKKYGELTPKYKKTIIKLFLEDVFKCDFLSNFSNEDRTLIIHDAITSVNIPSLTSNQSNSKQVLDSIIDQLGSFISKCLKLRLSSNLIQILSLFYPVYTRKELNIALASSTDNCQITEYFWHKAHLHILRWRNIKILNLITSTRMAQVVLAEQSLLFGCVD